MPGLGFLVVCALAALCVAQSNNDTQQFTPYFFPTPQQLPQGAGQVQAVLMQRMYSEGYASLILNFQSTMGWMQVSQGWLSMIQQEAAASKAQEAGSSFEEEEMVPLMFTAPTGAESHSADPAARYDETERASERALLSVIKIMYIQAGKKLSRAQDSHYQTKMQLSVLQTQPQFASIVSMMYYLEVLNVMSSAYTIQRQDAWNTWLLYEIIETDVFGNDIDNVPTEFARIMSKAQLAAMSTYYMEASIDLQIMFLKYYLMSATGIPAHANNAAANSFLEEESESSAEPNKPFFSPMMMMGGSNPQMMAYYTTMMKYWSVLFNFQAAQGLYQYAHMEEQSWTADHVDPAMSAQVKTYAVSALQQWAYLNMIQVMFDFQSFSMGAPTFQHAAAASANANAFVQTEAAPVPAPETAAAPEVTAEQKAMLDSVVSQFLRPQSILPQPVAAQ
jgi:hypothetical protein